MKDAITEVGLAAGSKVGSYLIDEPCGEGGFAVVYRATHEKLQRPAAIKVLHGQLLHREDLVERFTHEAQTITRIHHPNIVDIYDFGTLDDGRPYFAMEWLQGRPLDSEIMSHGRLPVDRAIAIAKEIAAGLEAIHSAGVVHRDLKASNVMLLDGSELRLKLLDFGIAKLLESDHRLSTPGMRLGTPVTMSPEQIRGRDVGPCSDIYSLGVLLFQMIAGRSPFQAERDAEIQEMHLHAPRPRPSDFANVSEHIDFIVQKCMAIDPSARYQSTAELNVDLAKAAAIRSSTGEDLAAGSVLADSYRIIGVLGRGGMGTVYDAEHTRLPKRLAIKVISGSISSESLARFRREAEIASGLGHSNIIRVLDFNTLPNGTPFMVMEHLDGHDLSAELKSGSLSLERATSIIRQTGSALAAAHKGGVVHRDLKPSNIFLSMSEIGGEIHEHVTVLDFGVSKIHGSQTVSTDTSALIGTPQYMAPEQAMGENERIDARSDQFALACLAYEMLSGKPAFAGERLAEIVYKVCHSEPISLDVYQPLLSRDVVSAVKRGMAKSPADRFSKIEDFVEAFSGRPLETLPFERYRKTPREPSEPALAQTQTERDPTTKATVREGNIDLADPSPADEAAATRQSTPRNKRDAIATAPEVPAAKKPDVRFSTVIPSKRGVELKQGARPRSSSLGKWLIGGAFGLVAVAFVAALIIGGSNPRYQDRSPWSKKSKASEEAAGEETTAVVKPALSSPTDAGSPIDATPARVSEPKDPVEDRDRPSQRKVEKPKLKKEARVALERAESAIKSGSYSAALRAVRKSMQIQTTGRTFFLMVQAYCGQGNIGAATDYLERVPKRKRRALIRYCRDEHDIELTN